MLSNYLYCIYNNSKFGINEENNYCFRNFNLFKDTAFCYNRAIPEQQTAKIIEFRKILHKKLNIVAALLFILVYVIFIQHDLSFWNLVLCTGLYFILFKFLSGYFTNIYSDFIRREIGGYKLTDYYTKITDEQKFQNLLNISLKMVCVAIFIGIYSAGIITMNNLIKNDIYHKNFSNAEILANYYSLLFPKTQKFYNMNAIIKYSQKDYKEALKNYKKVIEKSSKRFTKEDVIRFSNLLILEKKSSDAQNALEVFDKLISKKKMTTKDKTEMLWIKSMFSISSGITESIVADYDYLLRSLKKKDNLNKFYILSDKAYMLYLLGDYKNALTNYNYLISWAEKQDDKFQKETQRLYVERGYTNHKLGEHLSGDLDFIYSKLSDNEIENYEPLLSEGKFIIEKF